MYLQIKKKRDWIGQVIEAQKEYFNLMFWTYNALFYNVGIIQDIGAKGIHLEQNWSKA